MTTPLASFLFGAVTMGYAIAGLLFLRFCRRTGDRFFAAFAAAFWLLALGQIVVVIAGTDWWQFIPRLCAFALIIAAIIDKNRTAG